VLVLGKGQKLEYGSPKELMENEGGEFSQLVKAIQQDPTCAK